MLHRAATGSAGFDSARIGICPAYFLRCLLEQLGDQDHISGLHGLLLHAQELPQAIRLMRYSDVLNLGEKLIACGVEKLCQFLRQIAALHLGWIVGGDMLAADLKPELILYGGRDLRRRIKARERLHNVAFDLWI